ncbi:MAG TPA: transglutaminase domain-containing protein [Thermoleophilaceae bacterium]|jgi:hypothetical protein
MAVAGDTRRPAGDWLRSLRELVPIPEPYRDESMDRAAALEVLRCPEEVLDRVVAEGFPSSGEGEAQRFDRRDVYNLALHSGSGRSLPELGVAFLGRLGREGEQAWSEPRTWRIGAQIRCPRREGCGADPAWAFGRPVPEELGGELAESAPPGGSDPDADVYEWSGEPGSASLSATIATRGSVERLVSDEVRDAFMAVVEDYRFQVLPPALRTDLDSVERIRAADCIAATGVLVRDCRAAGLEAEPQSGFLLGLFGFGGHRWVRVRDSDGRWKSLDPTLAMIAALGGHDSGDFLEYCRGSILNRVVPCNTTPDGEVAGHSCDGESRLPDLAIRARRHDTD